MKFLINIALITFKKLKSEFINSLNDNKNIFSFVYHIISSVKKAFLNFFLNWDRYYIKIFLLLIIVTGILIRVLYIKSALPYIHNSDEMHNGTMIIQILQDGDFNPHYFNYPPLTTYLLLPFFVLNYFRLMSNGKLTSLQDILIGRDTGFPGTISHPSFYAVGRLAIILLAILSILLIYEVGKRYFNKKVGLISALILTFFSFHIRYSTVITPNMTVTFLVLLSLFLLSLYSEKGYLRYIIFAGLSAGLTVAAKYNSFLIIVPLILGILFYSNKKLRDIWIVSSSTAFGFFLGCPYAVLDFSTFLDHTGYDVWYYRVRGHIGFEGTSGIEQLKFYLGNFKDWINNIFHIKGSWNLSLIGTLLCFVLDIKNFFILFSFPILYIFYMSQQKVNFLRNMVCITPFIALSISIVLYHGYKILIVSLNRLRKNRLFHFKINSDLIFIGCLLILLIPLKPISVIKSAYKYNKTYKEPRTESVEFARDNFPNAKIGISMELRIHAYDLAKIQNKVLFNTEMVSLSYLYEENFDYIISSSSYFYYDKEKRGRYSDRIKILESKFPKKNIIKSFGVDHVKLDFLSWNPLINIYKVDKSFLNEKHIRKIKGGNINLDKEDLEKLFANDNLLRNGSLESWSHGSCSKPDFFEGGDNIFEGMIFREKREVKAGKYSAKIVGDNFNFTQILANNKDISGKKLTCFVWVKTNVPNKYRIKIDGGYEECSSERHSGSGDWVLLQAKLTVNPLARFIIVRIISARRTGNVDDVVYVDGALLVEGDWSAYYDHF